VFAIAAPAVGDVASQPVLALDPDRAPRNATLPNYDTNRNTDPGLTILQSSTWLVSTDPTEVQAWAFPDAQRELPATVSATFFVAPATAPSAGDELHVRAGIFRCNGPRTSCTRLRAETLVVVAPGTAFTSVRFDLSGAAVTIPGGFTLELRFAVPDSSDLDAWVAYDAVPFPSSITLGS